MRALLSVLCVWALGFLLIGALPGCAQDGGAGHATTFDASVPIAISGMSPYTECELFDPEEEGAHREVEPWISINPNDLDHFVASWIQDAALGFGTAVSFDGGKTWDKGTVPGISKCTGSEITRSSDPWLAFAMNGDLYSVALSHPRDGDGATSRIVVNKSIDGGLTWSDALTISESELPLQEDKPSITADPFDECRVYVGWTRFDDLSSATSGSEGEVLFSRTTDCGKTWSAPQALYRDEPSGMAFQTIVLPDGEVLAFFRQTQFTLARPRALYVMRSEDAGATWSPEPTLVATLRQVLPRTPDGEMPIRSAGNIYDVAVDRTTGRLVAVWEQLFDEDALVGEVQVAFTESLDGGLTWTEPVRVDQTPESADAVLNQAIVPTVEISDDGTIGVTYYNFQNDTPETPPSDTDYWFIHCHPSAADCTQQESWASPVRVTGESFDMLQASDTERGFFLGDYMGLTSYGSDFYAAFAISGPGDEQDIYFAAIEGR